MKGSAKKKRFLANVKNLKKHYDTYPIVKHLSITISRTDYKAIMRLLGSERYADLLSPQELSDFARLLGAVKVIVEADSSYGINTCFLAMGYIDDRFV